MNAMLANDDPAVYGRPPGFKTRMSEQDFVDWYLQSDEGVRAEWVAGEVILHMPDNIAHNKIEGLIYKILSEYVSSKDIGTVCFSRVQMRLPLKPSRREPDILFVSRQRETIVKETFIDGAPDLAMEIVSPSSDERDCHDKYAEYESAGVKEYWIIEPDKQTITIYVLNAQGFYEKIAARDGKFESRAVPGFYLREDWIINVHRVRLLDVLNEMAQ